MGALEAAKIHLEGNNHRDRQKAKDLLVEAHNAGLAKATALLVQTFSGDADIDSSWIKRAADQGEAEAEFMTARWLSQNQPSNAEWIFRYYLRAAEQNYPKAFIPLGLCYKTGIGVTKSLDMCLHWYHETARTGDREAFSHIASLYAGSFRDDRLAAKYAILSK